MNRKYYQKDFIFSVLGRALRLVKIERSQSYVLFVTLVCLHLCFKVLLGLMLTFESNYGFSLVSPPMSLLMVASDTVFAYLLVVLVERLSPDKWHRWVSLVVFVVVGLFLLSNYATYTYFKSFITYGLIRFNGGDSGELLAYFVNALDLMFGIFIAITVVLTGVLVFFALKKKPDGSLGKRRPWYPVITTIAAVVVWSFLGNLGWAQTGRLVRDPFISLAGSTITGLRMEQKARADALDIEGFEPPSQPIFGTHISTFDGADTVSETISKLSKPNVLMILVETLATEWTPLDGHAENPLKIISKLQKNSIEFPSFRTIFPATTRSFITTHCGTYPDTGFDTITRYMSDFACIPFTQILRDNGYVTGFFTPAMFSYDNLDSAEFMTQYDVNRDYFSYKKRSKTSHLTARAVEEEVVADDVFEFMIEHKNKGIPFFADYFMYWSHSPYHLPTDNLTGMAPLDRYKRTLGYINEVLTSLIGKMEESGLLEDTIVIVTADHGEGFGLHHVNYNHSSHLYEDTIRVPLLITVPGMTAPLKNKRNGTNVDFAPTLLALLGLKSPSHWEGQSLIGDAFEAKPSLIFARSTYQVNGIIDGNYKFFYYLNHTKQNHFYDISKDPFEQDNLIGSMGTEAEHYKQIIDKWLVYQQLRITQKGNSLETTPH